MGNELLKQVRMLYVEDEDIARMAVHNFLKRFAGEVHVATNGAEGLALYQAHRPAVVVTDLEMPVMNGMEMISRIRDLDRQIPIIITTAYDDEAHQCPQADRVILKPIRFMELLGAVEEMVAARSASA